MNVYDISNYSLYWNSSYKNKQWERPTLWGWTMAPDTADMSSFIVFYNNSGNIWFKTWPGSDTLSVERYRDNKIETVILA